MLFLIYPTYNEIMPRKKLTSKTFTSIKDQPDNEIKLLQLNKKHQGKSVKPGRNILSSEEIMKRIRRSF